MSIFRQLRTISLSFLILGLLIQNAFAASLIDDKNIFSDQTSPYTDVNVDDVLTDDETLAILMLSQAQFNGHVFLVGYTESDGTRTFRPNNLVNRAEAAKYFTTSSPTYVNDVGSSRYNTDCFSDLANIGTPWYMTYACLAKDAGIIGGYPDGTFRAENTLNNAEIMKFVVKTFALDEYSDVDTTESANSPWYDGYRQVLEELNIIPSGLNPSANPTRGELADYIFKALVVSQVDSGEAYDGYQLMLYIENQMDASGVDPLQGFIHEPSDDLYILSVNPTVANEFVTIENGGSSDIDLSGYYVRLWNKQSFSDYQPSQVEYVFPEGTTLAAGKTVEVYSQEGDHVLEGGDRYGDGGLVDKIMGTYAYVLYSPNDKLVDVVGFKIP